LDVEIVSYIGRAGDPTAGETAHHRNSAIPFFVMLDGCVDTASFGVHGKGEVWLAKLTIRSIDGPLYQTCISFQSMLP
jgi:hypothetical protein